MILYFLGSDLNRFACCTLFPLLFSSYHSSSLLYKVFRSSRVPIPAEISILKEMSPIDHIVLLIPFKIKCTDNTYGYILRVYFFFYGY